MICFRELHGISYRDHITNEEVKIGNGNAIGPYEDLLTSAKRRKLMWYGHVTRSSGQAKAILQGDEAADRGNDGKTTSKSELALDGIYNSGKLRTARSGGSWLWNLQWWSNRQPNNGIGEGEGVELGWDYLTLWCGAGLRRSYSVVWGLG